MSSGNRLIRRWREWRERQRESHQAEELKHLLTTEPSIVSRTGWRIYNPQLEEQVTYREKPNSQFQVVTYDYDEGLLYIRVDGMNTCITAEPKNGSGELKGVKFTIYDDDASYLGTSDDAVLFEWYFSRMGNLEGIKTGIVVFENVSKDRLHYFQVQPSRSSDAVGLVEMEKVTA